MTKGKIEDSNIAVHQSCTVLKDSRHRGRNVKRTSGMPSQLSGNGSYYKKRLAQTCSEVSRVAVEIFCVRNVSVHWHEHGSN